VGKKTYAGIGGHLWMGTYCLASSLVRLRGIGNHALRLAERQQYQPRHHRDAIPDDSKSATTAVSGATCVLRAGTYYETVTPNSGIRITAYPGETVTIDGTEVLTGWSLHQGSIYVIKTTLSANDQNQIFVNGQMMTEARWPNTSDLFHVNWAQAQQGTNTSILADWFLPPIDWTGAKIHFVSGTDGWSPEIATVTGSARGQLTFTLDDATYPPDIQPQPGGLYFLYRTLGALDSEGEWYYDSNASQLYFWAPGGVNPNTLDVRAKVRQYAFDLSSRSGVTIPNIELFACSINMNSSSSNNVLDGLNVMYVSHYTDNLDNNPNPTSYWQDHNLDTGIILNGSGNTLKNSAIAWSAGNGVAVMGTNQTVFNNLIYNTGYNGNDAVGISLFGTGHSIQYNTIHAGGQYLITIYSYPVNPLNNDVSFNNLFNAMLLGPDGGAFYTSEATGTGTRIHNNWVHDTQTAIFPVCPVGIYLDEGSVGFEVDQNVMWNNQCFNFYFNGANFTTFTTFNNNVHNNSIPDIGPVAYMQFYGVSNCGTNLVADNLVLEPVNYGLAAGCTLPSNNPTAPGATTMTGAQVGCNFAGCASEGPPSIVGGAVAASIVFQPLSTTVPAGSTATFRVIAAGSPTLRYQWQENGVAINGATAASYTTPVLSAGDNDSSFTVQVMNGAGIVTSSAATLTIGSFPPQAFLACDLNRDGSVNAADVQLLVNQALGLIAPTADLYKNGVVNVVDVQAGAGTALGLLLCQ
jgi:hypothetical protein